jgi:hypothetical protein
MLLLLRQQAGWKTCALYVAHIFRKYTEHLSSELQQLFSSDEYLIVILHLRAGYYTGFVLRRRTCVT